MRFDVRATDPRCAHVVLCGIYTSITEREIRIHEEGEYRVLYLAKFADTVYVLHVFSKKTRKTPKQDLDLASERFRAVIEERKRQKR